MRFKKFLSTVCASALLFSSIFCCKAENPIEVVFVGDSQTGKTPICNKLAGNDFNEYEPTTVGIASCTEYIDNNIRFRIWGTAGQEKFRSITPIYLRRGAKIVGIFLDVSKKGYMERLNYWLDFVNDIVPNSKKIIVLSKTDLHEQSKLEAAKQAIRDAHRDIHENQIISCSAKTGIGVETLKCRMFELAKQVQREEEQRQQEQPPSPFFPLEEEDAPEQPKKKSLTFWTLVTTGISAIGYGTYKVCKYFTSNDKDKNVNADNIKKNYRHTKVTA